MTILKSILNWTVSVALWLLVKENRRMGLRYTKKALDIISYATLLTKSRKDDEIVNNIRKIILDIPEELSGKVIKKINSQNTGSLKTVKIGFDEKKGLSAGVSINF